MNSTAKRLLLLSIVLLFAAVAGLVDPAGSPGSAVVAQEPTPLPGGPIPCDPEGSREIIPRIVEAGGEVEVRVHFNFSCTGEDRVINFFIVLENTSFMGGPRNAALVNIKAGLQDFVNAVNFTESQGGLTLFANDYTNRVPLQGGNDGKQVLLNAISRISVEPIGSASGAGGAIRNATERLPTGVNEEGVTNVILFIDAGAPLVEPPLVDLGSACQAAAAAGVHVMYVGLEPAGLRNAGCATPGWWKASIYEDARDFPEIMDEFATRLVKGATAQEYEYADAKRSDFEYVAGSAQPEEPDITVLGDLSWWYQTGDIPAGGRNLTYKIKVPDENVANGFYVDTLQKISINAALWMTYQVGEPSRPFPLANPDICIHRKGDPSFCDGKFVTPSPTSTQQTPLPSDTPDGATETPTDTVTDTPDVPTDVPTAIAGRCRRRQPRRA